MARFPLRQQVDAAERWGFGIIFSLFFGIPLSGRAPFRSTDLAPDASVRQPSVPLPVTRRQDITVAESVCYSQSGLARVLISMHIASSHLGQCFSIKIDACFGP